MGNAQVALGEPVEINIGIQTPAFLSKDSNVQREKRVTSRFLILLWSFFSLSLVLLTLWNVFLSGWIKLSGIERNEFKNNIEKLEVLENTNRNLMKDALRHKAISLCFRELIGVHQEKYNSEEIQRCIQIIGIADARYGHKGLDAPLILSWLEKESDGDPQAVSYAGAKGIAQLMDFRAEEIFIAMGYLGYDEELVFNPLINLAGGIHHLDELMRFWKNNGIKSKSLILFYALHSYKWGVKNTELLFNTERRAFRPAIKYVNWILNRREYWSEIITSKMNDPKKLTEQWRGRPGWKKYEFLSSDE